MVSFQTLSTIFFPDKLFGEGNDAQRTRLTQSDMNRIYANVQIKYVGTKKNDTETADENLHYVKNMLNERSLHKDIHCKI